MIDLYSDTRTRPTRAMRQAMFDAEVGDDMSGLDPTVNRLEAMVAAMFGMEAAVYACSATQSNQMGVATHTQPGDELLIHETGHVANYEAGAPAVLSGVTVRTLTGEKGMLDLPQLDGKIRPDDQHLCRTRLVCVENTTNSGGGRAYPLAQLQRVSRWARGNGLKVHLDGARLFNAIVARGYSTTDVGACCDTISICFSKGLGCPMGAILLGSAEDIRRARRVRKLFGGALRQAGVVAATAIYALENHVERLAEDHANAKLFAESIADVPGVRIDPAETETNLVFFEVEPELGTGASVCARLEEQGVIVGAMGPQRLRACTHLDVSRDDVARAAGILRDCLSAGPVRDASPAASPYAN
ncbi:MAG: threonine aldolase family protein [Planctomycetaceae bacterium]